MDPTDQKNIMQMQGEALKYWCNMVLAEKDIKIENLAEELKDGHTFPTLVQTLTKSEIKGLNPNCKFTMQKLSNITLALDELRRCGIEDVSSAENFVNGLEKSVLGTLFFMFEYFELSTVRGNAQKNLKDMCNEKIKDYNIEISSLRNIAKNNTFFALIDSAKKNGYPYQDKSIESVADIQHALDYAERELGIPRIVDFVYLHRSHDISLLELFLFFLCKLSDTPAADPQIPKETAEDKTVQISEEVTENDIISQGIEETNDAAEEEKEIEKEKENEIEKVEKIVTEEQEKIESEEKEENVEQNGMEEQNEEMEDGNLQNGNYPQEVDQEQQPVEEDEIVLPTIQEVQNETNETNEVEKNETNEEVETNEINEEVETNETIETIETIATNEPNETKNDQINIKTLKVKISTTFELNGFEIGDQTKAYAETADGKLFPLDIVPLYTQKDEMSGTYKVSREFNQEEVSTLGKNLAGFKCFRLVLSDEVVELPCTFNAAD